MTRKQRSQPRDEDVIHAPTPEQVAALTAVAKDPKAPRTRRQAALVLLRFYRKWFPPRN
jgi:hypothetical protein